MSDTLHDASGCTAWNPGVETRIPREFRALETICRPECAFSSPQLLDELGAMTGLPPEELADLRPERLALHELIVRITADIAVEEGASEENFGQNFRAIAHQILADHITPNADVIKRVYTDLQRDAGERVRSLLTAALGHVPEPPQPRSLIGRLFRKAPPPSVRAETAAEREHRVIARFKATGLAASDPLERAVFKSLYRVLGTIATTRTTLGGDLEMLGRLVTQHVCNTYGSRLIGRTIAPMIDAAIEQQGYTRVLNRATPVLISLKGASAAGKSSIRPMIKRVMRESGIESDGYATISPDVWRRLLLDYESLGPARKYAGQLTSREVMVIDGKLDRHISDKARQAQAIPHLLVDRFRFDSFSSKQIARVLHETYTRYVSTIHMYFIVTPPEETVERGWQRALERGRYKAVEDFLGHCVEAYSGMPRMLFKWLAHQPIDYRYYFLDNLVPKGTFPTPIAFGNRREMTIYDASRLVDIGRYEHINIHARSRAEVYPDGYRIDITRDSAFLRNCLRRIPLVTFRDGPNGVRYLEFRQGTPRLLDGKVLDRLTINPYFAAILREIAPKLDTSA
ncbi:MAG TPA: zeta toxin family protein [Aromatoleum sp.]|uniref:zeta toxin family protein n=1 Tax=Aromatoleum sp. TaxID=2307007 RepID=UPI002B480392|nr:zeta toxin family protein [Aromatoleum sp.]HJV25156.1 zeta toxin family protein [Aromatoleum sp.]